MKSVINVRSSNGDASNIFLKLPHIFSRLGLLFSLVYERRYYKFNWNIECVFSNGVPLFAKQMFGK